MEKTITIDGKELQLKIEDGPYDLETIDSWQFVKVSVSINKLCMDFCEYVDNGQLNDSGDCMWFNGSSDPFVDALKHLQFEDPITSANDLHTIIYNYVQEQLQK